MAKKLILIPKIKYELLISEHIQRNALRTFIFTINTIKENNVLSNFLKEHAKGNTTATNVLRDLNSNSPNTKKKESDEEKYACGVCDRNSKSKNTPNRHVTF